MEIILYLKYFPARAEPLKSGINKAVHGFASGLVAQDAEVTVVCEGGSDSIYHTAVGYEVRCFKSDARPRSFRIAPGLKSYFATKLPNRLVVLNSMFTPSLFSLSRFLKKEEVPFVVAPHAEYHPSLFRKNPFQKWPYWILLERRMLKWAEAIQVLDERHGASLRRLGVDRPLIIAPNGVSYDDVIPYEVLRWRLEGPARLLYWGRLDVHHKGLDILLEAFSRFDSKHDVRLTIQGPDPRGERRQLEETVLSLPNPERVTILPPIFDTPAPLVMLEHDAVCLSSRYEGFPMAVLEAMLAARVVLLPRSIGAASQVDDSGCGILVDELNAAAVYDGLEALLARRSEWREMGIRGREYVLQFLRWEVIARDVLQQYRSLVGKE